MEIRGCSFLGEHIGSPLRLVFRFSRIVGVDRRVYPNTAVPDFFWTLPALVEIRGCSRAYRLVEIATQDYPINNNTLLLKLLMLAVQFASKLALRSLNRNFRLAARGHCGSKQ